jgi:ABC-2 type transport system ATP-binding protein
VEIIEGVTPATSGEVFYFGEPAGGRFREEVGIQFQHTALQDFLTVRETLELFQSLYDRSADIGEILGECSLIDLQGRNNRKLSGGQRQRLLLAVALVNRPRLVFLDEPTTGLDPQARRNFWNLVDRIRGRGTTVVLTTHYMDEAQILCDEIVIMDTGRIIAQGNPKALLEHRYSNVVIELPIEDVRGDLGSIEHRILETEGIIEIPTDDVNASLRQLAAQVHGLNRLRTSPAIRFAPEPRHAETYLRRLPRSQPRIRTRPRHARMESPAAGRADVRPGLHLRRHVTASVHGGRPAGFVRNR